MIGRLLRTLFYLLFFGAFLLGGLALLLVQPDPLVRSATPPEQRHVEATKDLLKRFREATETSAATSTVRVSAQDLESVFTLAGRVVSGARSETQVGDGFVRVEASVPIRVMGVSPWLNISAEVPDFQDGVALNTLRIGGLSVPPGLAVSVASAGVSLWLGAGAGPELIAGFPQMTAQDNHFDVTVAVGRSNRSDLAQKVFSVFRGADMPNAHEIAVYSDLLYAAAASGRVPLSGSFSTHLSYLMNAAYEAGAESDPARAFTAAVFALAEACGSEHIKPYMARLYPGGDPDTPRRSAPVPCGEAGLNGRVDLRRHFVTAAALQAASNRGVAVSIGEFKELSDMAGRGFDFTDVVANNSGIRLSDHLMSMPYSGWPAVLDLLEDEQNIIPGIDGIPGPVKPDEFKRLYGDLNSPAYHAMLDEIEGRIDRLPLYR